MARRIVRYLNWLGLAARIFNVGNYRRTVIGAGQSADFFSADNPEALYALHQQYGHSDGGGAQTESKKPLESAKEDDEREYTFCLMHTIE